MRATNKLDPATLRWVADECIGEANAFYSAAKHWNEHCDADSQQRALKFRDWAKWLAVKARRYCSLATRIENRRKR